MENFPLPLTAIATLVTMILYMWITLNVARARTRYGVVAPHVTGDETFQRIYRVQCNTVEQLALFLPMLWLTAVLTTDWYAAAVGGFWVLGRFLYAVGYYRNARSRRLGFNLNLLALVLLFCAAAGALVEPQLKLLMQ